MHILACCSSRRFIRSESKPDLFVEVLELQRSLKASQTEQQDALERAAAAVTQEQKATQNSLLQVHCKETSFVYLGIRLYSNSVLPSD